MRKELYTEVMSNMIQKYWAISKNEMKWVDKKRLAEFEFLLDDFIRLQSDNDRYRDVVVKNATKCMELVKGYCAVEVIKEYIKQNEKIKSFIYKVAYMYNVLFDKTVDGIMEKVCAFEKSDVFSNDIWALNSIYYINKDKFNSVSNELLSDESEYEKIYEDAKLIYLKNNMYLLYESGDNSFDVIKLPDIKRDEDNTWFKMEYYFKGYEESFDIEITDEDINTLNGYNDEKLRSKIAKIIVNIDHHIVERESKKPHGALEISDMELPIRPQGKFTTYYLCIPVKSGVEIRNKVDESICYQIIRPFTNFANRAVVVFVSAKEASEAFYNYVKRAKANLNFDIYILEGKSLAKVLKYNNFLD